MSAQSETVRRLTVVDIAKLYADGTRIATITAYDYPTAALVDEAGIPLILVGDSLAQVLLGYDTTVRISMDEMLHHTKAVVRGTKRALVVGDMPFLSYSSPDDAVANAGRFLREGGAQAVKVEGGVRTARTIEALVRAGIPVMGHIGLTPQAINAIGRVRVQGKNKEQARSLLADALAVQEAGAFAVVLELVPGQLARASVLAELAAGTVDPSPQRGVADRVERDRRVAHPGLRVGPALDLRLAALTLQLVDIGRAGGGSGDQAGRVSALALERIDIEPHGIGEQPLGMCTELGASGLVELSRGIRDRVDVPGRDRTRGQGVLERRHRRAHPLALVGGAGILA